MKKTRKRRSKRGGDNGSLASMTTAELIGELGTRRAALQAELTAIDEQLAGFGATVGGRPTIGAPGRRGPKPTAGPATGGRGGKGRGRGGNERSLSAVLHSLLTGNTLSVPEMAEAAKKAGYKSKSKNFRTIVSLTMLNNRKMFRRVSRGRYTAK